MGAALFPGLVLVVARVPHQPGAVPMAVFDETKNPLEPLVGLTRTQPPGRAGLTVPRQQVLPRLPLRERDRARPSPTRSRRPRTGSTRTSSTAIVNGVGKGGKRTGDWSTATSTSAWSTALSTLSGTVASETGHALQPVQSGKVNQYGALLFGAATVGAIVLILINVVRRHASWISATTTSAQPRHLPAAGRRAGDAVRPGRRGDAAQADRHRHVGRHARGRHLDAGAVRLRPGRDAAVRGRREVDRGHQVELHDRPRRHQPAALHPVDGGHVPRRDLHVGQHARRRQPEVVPDADARAAGRHGRHVHRPGPDPVLRVLRGRAAADVLHDRRVGRRAAPVRLAQVLPLHDVRLGADARRLPRAVLPDRRRELRRSPT